MILERSLHINLIIMIQSTMVQWNGLLKLYTMDISDGLVVSYKSY